jgi:putative ABC transport system substrate-binding protein
MKRREFIAALGGAGAWPLAASAQQPAMPVIGYFNAATADGYSESLHALRQGLKESGYVEGENLAIEYRWADNQPDRLPVLVADLIRRRVNVIVANSAPASVAVAKATTTIPIVFLVPEDPVALGLVTSLSRPGGNMTGVNFFAAELAAKRLELLRALVPAATRVAALLNPAEPTIAAANLRDVEAAAGAMGLQLRVLNASTIADIDAARRPRGSRSSGSSSRPKPARGPTRSIGSHNLPRHWLQRAPPNAPSWCPSSTGSSAMSHSFPA